MRSATASLPGSSGRSACSQDTLGRSARSRFAPQPRRGVVLGERDRELLSSLFLHRAMSRGQIQALFFNSVPRCNDRLRQLYDWGYVSRYYWPSAPYGSQAVYHIGRAAVPLLAERLEMEEAEVRRQCRGRPQFLEHTLEIVGFYVALKDAVSEKPGTELETWLPEALCRHEYELRPGSGGMWRKEVFNPDGFARLLDRNSSSYRSYFLEVDLGHTASRQFLGKLQGHRRYLESGLFHSTYGCSSFKTLVITTGQGRLRNLLSLVREQGSDLFWFTTFAQMRETGALAPIWQAASSDRLHSLL